MIANFSPATGVAPVMAIILAMVSSSALWAQDPNRVKAGQNTPVQADANTPPADAAIRQQIEDFFTEYETAMRADTADELLKMVDFKAFADFVLDQAQIEFPEGIRRLLVTRLIQATKQEFGIAGEAWDRHRVLQATPFKDGKTVEVFVRTWSEDGESSRNIFWLEKSDRWRIIDWLDVELGIRNSTLISSILRETHASKQSKESIQTLNLLNQLFVAARQQDVDSTDELLADLTGRYVPNSIEGLRWIVEASTASYYEPLAALEATEKAEAFEPDAVLTDYLRLKAYFDLGEYQRTIHHAQRYLNRFGADESTYLIKGLAHAELGQIDAALESYEAGLEDNPQSFDLISQYVSDLPEDQKDKASQYFLAIPNLMESFEDFADDFEANEEYIALQILLDAATSIGETVPHREYYESIVLQGQGDPTAAMEKLIAAVDQLDADDYYREYYEQAICTAAIKSSQVMRAYEICEDKVACFRSLLNGLHAELNDQNTDSQAKPDDQVRSKAEADIDELVAKHLATHSADWLTFVILGDRAYYNEDYEKAKTHYESALKYRSKDDSSDTFLYNVVDCHIETDSIIAYYQSSDFKQQVYDIARYRLSSDSQEYQELQRLHRANFPNLPEFVLSQMETLYAEGRYQEAYDAFARLEVEENEEEKSYLMQQIEFIRVLCLARLGKNDDAILSARRLEEEYRDIARALIFAIRNDRNGFRGAVQRLIAAEQELSREEFAEWVDVPEAWFEGLISKDSSTATSNPAGFAPYDEIRRLVFLANEPVPLDMRLIREAAADAGLSLFEIHRQQLLTEQENYVCALSPDAFIVSSKGFKFFLYKREARFLDQLSSAGIEYDESDEALQSRIAEHASWFSIDVLAWPQATDRQGPSAIPQDAVRRMIQLADSLMGGKATVAIHVDGAEAVACDPELFSRLKASPKIDSLRPAETVDAD